MEIGNHRIDGFKNITGINKQVAAAASRRHSAPVIGSILKGPHTGGAHRNDPLATGPGRIDDGFGAQERSDEEGSDVSDHELRVAAGLTEAEAEVADEEHNAVFFE